MTRKVDQCACCTQGRASSSEPRSTKLQRLTPATCQYLMVSTRGSWHRLVPTTGHQPLAGHERERETGILGFARIMLTFWYFSLDLKYLIMCHGTVRETFFLENYFLKWFILSSSSPGPVRSIQIHYIYTPIQLLILPSTNYPTNSSNRSSGSSSVRQRVCLSVCVCVTFMNSSLNPHASYALSSGSLQALTPVH